MFDFKHSCLSCWLEVHKTSLNKIWVNIKMGFQAFLQQSSTHCSSLCCVGMEMALFSSIASQVLFFMQIKHVYPSHCDASLLSTLINGKTTCILKNCFKLSIFMTYYQWMSHLHASLTWRHWQAENFKKPWSRKGKATKLLQMTNESKSRCGCHPAAHSGLQIDRNMHRATWAPCFLLCHSSQSTLKTRKEFTRNVSKQTICDYHMASRLYEFKTISSL